MLNLLFVLARIVVFGLTVLAVAGACGFGDSAMSVRNDTNEAWFIRSPFGDAYPDKVSIVRIEPHGEGIVASWRGDRDFAIELLDLSCDLMGTFESADGQSFSVNSVAGLTGTLTTLNPLTHRNGEGVPIGVLDCGGYLLM